jgi:hypothetical protein
MSVVNLYMPRADVTFDNFRVRLAFLPRWVLRLIQLLDPRRRAD